MVDCKCKEWQDSIQQIDAAQTLADCHGFTYTGSVMRFCPWCGEKLEIPEQAGEDNDG